MVLNESWPLFLDFFLHLFMLDLTCLDVISLFTACCWVLILLFIKNELHCSCRLTYLKLSFKALQMLWLKHFSHNILYPSIFRIAERNTSVRFLSKTDDKMYLCPWAGKWLDLKSCVLLRYPCNWPLFYYWVINFACCSQRQRKI